MDNQQKTEMLLNDISRYDLYINSVNSKVAFILAFNSAVLFAITQKHLNFITCNSMTIIYISLLLLSCAFSFWAVKPYLFSGNKSGSLRFFKDVAAMKKEVYLSRIEKLNYEEYQKDLASQAKALAYGLNSKMNCINISIIILVITLFLLGLDLFI